MLEAEKRTETFDEPNSVRIVLADGQGWAFLKPWLQLRPRFDAGKVARVDRAITYDSDSDQLIEAIADGQIDQFSGVASLAAWLLRKSYCLSEAELDQLLAFRPDDAVSTEWTWRVMGVATGRFGVAMRSEAE